jgi:hypothetical protein
LGYPSSHATAGAGVECRAFVQGLVNISSTSTVSRVVARVTAVDASECPHGDAFESETPATPTHARK